MSKARCRFISFRVTNDEFEQLKIACESQGARSLSAFARRIILNSTISGGENMSETIAALNSRISVLEVSLSRLSMALEK